MVLKENGGKIQYKGCGGRMVKECYATWGLELKDNNTQCSVCCSGDMHLEYGINSKSGT